MLPDNLIQNIFKANISKSYMKAGRKITGGRYKRTKKRKLSQRHGQTRVVKLADPKTKFVRTRGGAKKLVALSDNEVNVVYNGKSKKVGVENVLETPSNVFLARQNILVKGAIIQTELGKAVITNRPSQEGFVQAKVIVE